MEVYLIRHTMPAVEKGVCYGQADVPLHHTFFNEANEVLKKLPGDAEAIFSSPLVRCAKLAEMIGNKFQIPVIFDKRLMEINFGEWELKEWNSIDEDHLTHWMADYVHVACPGGESYHELYNRCAEFWNDLLTMPYRSVIVVTHHAVLKSLYAHLCKRTLTEAMGEQFNYGSITHCLTSGENKFNRM